MKLKNLSIRAWFVVRRHRPEKGTGMGKPVVWDVVDGPCYSLLDGMDAKSRIQHEARIFKDAEVKLVEAVLKGREVV